MTSRVLLVVLGLITDVVVFGQQRITFIIDTLDAPEFDFIVLHGRVMGISPDILSDAVHGVYSSSAYPNFLASFPMSPDLAIQVPLTKDGGMIHLHVPDSGTLDTIRISRYEVLPDCAWDSISTTIVWRNLSGLAGDVKRVDHSIGPMRNQHKCKSFVSPIRMVVNAHEITIPIHPRRSPLASEVTQFHGYKPRKCGGMNAENKGFRKCLRMDGTSYMFGWRLCGEVFLP